MSWMPPSPRSATSWQGWLRRRTRPRRLVTILFADVSGFTSMAETRDAEEVNEAMNELWRRVDGRDPRAWRIDRQAHGRRGHGIVGSDRSARGRPRARSLGGTRNPEEIGLELAGRPLRVRVGINTGMVLVGRVGTRGETTAVGDAVNVASRLEELAAPGTILVSHDTYRHVRGVFDVREEQPVAVRGRGEPVRVYTVLAAKRQRFRLSTRGVEGIETRMIGREAELNALIEMMRETIDEREPRVVTVFGEAGLGKSRLMFEFMSAVELSPSAYGCSRSRPSGDAGSPVRTCPGPVRFPVRHSTRATPPRSSAPSSRTEWRSSSAPGKRAARRPTCWVSCGIRLLRELDRQADARKSASDPDRALRYAAEFMRRVTQKLPAVVLLEDIHWADHGSLDFVDQVTRACAGARLFVLCLARHSLLERRPSWGRAWPTTSGSTCGR